MQTTGCSVMELLFNAFQQGVRPGLDSAQAQGIGRIAKVPLDSGWLASRYGAASRFGGVRGRWQPEVIERRAALVAQVAALLTSDVTLDAATVADILALWHREIEAAPLPW